jgi:hypothetical protein
MSKHSICDVELSTLQRHGSIGVGFKSNKKITYNGRWTVVGAVVVFTNQFLFIFGLILFDKEFFTWLFTRISHIFCKISVAIIICNLIGAYETNENPWENRILSEILIAPAWHKVEPHEIFEITDFSIDPIVRFIGLGEVLERCYINTEYTFVQFEPHELREKSINVSLDQIEHIWRCISEKNFHTAASLIKPALFYAFNIHDPPAHGKDLFAAPAADSHVVVCFDVTRSKTELNTMYINSP